MRTTSAARVLGLALLAVLALPACSSSEEKTVCYAGSYVPLTGTTTSEAVGPGACVPVER